MCWGADVARDSLVVGNWSIGGKIRKEDVHTVESLKIAKDETGCGCLRRCPKDKVVSIRRVPL